MNRENHVLGLRKACTIFFSEQLTIVCPKVEAPSRSSLSVLVHLMRFLCGLRSSWHLPGKPLRAVIAVRLREEVSVLRRKLKRDLSFKFSAESDQMAALSVSPVRRHLCSSFRSLWLFKGLCPCNVFFLWYQPSHILLRIALPLCPFRSSSVHRDR